MPPPIFDDRDQRVDIFLPPLSLHGRVYKGIEPYVIAMLKVLPVNFCNFFSVEWVECLIDRARVP